MTPDELRKLADEATPGPWSVADIPNGQSVRIALGGHDSFRFFTHTSENARLIALAPDLARLCAEAIEALAEIHPSGLSDYDAVARRAVLTRLSELSP